jgi:hypothetical protein
LIDLFADDERHDVANRLMEHLDGEYWEVVCDAYANGVEDGRALGAAESQATIQTLREQLATLEKLVRGDDPTETPDALTMH